MAESMGTTVTESRGHLLERIAALEKQLAARAPAHIPAAEREEIQRSLLRLEQRARDAEARADRAEAQLAVRQAETAAARAERDEATARAKAAEANVETMGRELSAMPHGTADCFAAATAPPRFAGVPGDDVDPGIAP